jgi:hypothetical protein
MQDRVFEGEFKTFSQRENMSKKALVIVVSAGYRTEALSGRLGIRQASACLSTTSSGGWNSERILLVNRKPWDIRGV